MALFGLLPHTPVVDVFVVFVATGLIWMGSGWLEGSAEQLSMYYGLPAVVQGSIVVAVGSSFPELSSVVFAALSGVFDIGVGAIVGSAIFNILAIPAFSALVSDEPLETNRTLVYKEAQFYMIAVSVLVVTFAFAVIYAPVPDGPPLLGRITRPLAMLPLLLYGLYLFIQWQDVNDHDAERLTDDIQIERQWLTLVAGLAVILVAVEQLVGSVESLSTTFGIPELLAGVTIVAAATSLPDLLVSVRAARRGKSVTSLANVLGSNTFDLLVAIPLGVLIAGSVVIDFATAVPMMGVLTLATVLLFAALRTDLSLTKYEAYALIVSYLLFVAWIIAEVLGVTGALR
ncbi:sodium:calcium antiporter [Halobellus sp. Atlit-38R]|uniref:sodium:calcium antiporter n=1 Tax=Halobellus sp. Atlit-38R TaxID=2282131 RepID=UPI000EF27F67|nr:sodium:calcium antiporter [Halobellus sp. Atlit-38R]RLM88650.1 sodium:calcium antiporter [Halobellus sp. Atlit-38R]